MNPYGMFPMSPWMGMMPGQPGMTPGQPQQPQWSPQMLMQMLQRFQQPQGNIGLYGSPGNVSMPPGFNPQRMRTLWDEKQGNLFNDRSGLSNLWSQLPTSTTTGPGGWETSVTPSSPFQRLGLGGLLGNIFGRRA